MFSRENYENWEKLKIWRQRPLSQFFSKSEIEKYKKSVDFKKYHVLFTALELRPEDYSDFSNDDIETLILLSREKKLNCSLITLNSLAILSVLDGVNECHICNVLPLYNKDLDNEVDELVKDNLFCTTMLDIFTTHIDVSLQPCFEFLLDQAKNSWVSNYEDPRKTLDYFSGPNQAYEFLESIIDPIQDHHDGGRRDHLTKEHRDSIHEFLGNLMKNFKPDYPNNINMFLVHYIVTYRRKDLVLLSRQIFEYNNDDFATTFGINYGDIMENNEMEITKLDYPFCFKCRCSISCRKPENVCRMEFNKNERIRFKKMMKEINDLINRKKYRRVIEKLNQLYPFKLRILNMDFVYQFNKKLKNEERIANKMIIGKRSECYSILNEFELSQIDSLYLRSSEEIQEEEKKLEEMYYDVNKSILNPYNPFSPTLYRSVNKSVASFSSKFEIGIDRSNRNLKVCYDRKEKILIYTFNDGKKSEIIGSKLTTNEKKEIYLADVFTVIPTDEVRFMILRGPFLLVVQKRNIIHSLSNRWGCFAYSEIFFSDCRNHGDTNLVYVGQQTNFYSADFFTNFQGKLGIFYSLKHKIVVHPNVIDDISVKFEFSGYNYGRGKIVVHENSLFASVGYGLVEYSLETRLLLRSWYFEYKYNLVSISFSNSFFILSHQKNGKRFLLSEIDHFSIFSFNNNIESIKKRKDMFNERLIPLCNRFKKSSSYSSFEGNVKRIGKI